VLKLGKRRCLGTGKGDRHRDRVIRIWNQAVRKGVCPTDLLSAKKSVEPGDLLALPEFHEVEITDGIVESRSQTCGKRKCPFHTLRMMTGQYPASLQSLPGKKSTVEQAAAHPAVLALPARYVAHRWWGRLGSG
jgi:hypothetical protein